MDHKAAQPKTSQRGNVIAGAIAGIFGLIILTVLLLISLIILVVLLLTFIGSTPESLPQENDEQAAGNLAALQVVTDTELDCALLIEKALQVSDADCQGMGRDEVCYGNYTVKAQLAPDTSEQFSIRGDIIPLDSLRSLLAAPLDLSKEEWGIAVFKVQANLPRTVPGQNVTFLVFGDTSVDNRSGDMRAFYFSTGLGPTSCEQLPPDGIMVSMPDGTGIVFDANGVRLTLMGTAVMQAGTGQDMTVSLLSGTGMVSANGESQAFGSGYGVSVPLGGSDGLQASGTPSSSFLLSDELLAMGCSVAGCNPDDIELISPEEALALLQEVIGVVAQAGSQDGSGTGTTTESNGSNRGGGQGLGQGVGGGRDYNPADEGSGGGGGGGNGGGGDGGGGGGGNPNK